MRKYLIANKSALVDSDPDGEDYLARTIYEPDDTPMDTGLIDKHGNRIFAVDDRRPIGYVTRD